MVVCCVVLSCAHASVVRVCAWLVVGVVKSRAQLLVMRLRQSTRACIMGYVCLYLCPCFTPRPHNNCANTTTPTTLQHYHTYLYLLSTNQLTNHH